MKHSQLDADFIHGKIPKADELFAMTAEVSALPVEGRKS